MNSETWHRYYARWYDHRAEGHKIRAGIYGWITDRIAARLAASTSSNTRSQESP